LFSVNYIVKALSLRVKFLFPVKIKVIETVFIHLLLYSPLLDLDRILKYFTQLVGLLGQGISRRKPATYKQDNTNTESHTIHTFMSRVEFNSRSWCLSGRRQFMLYTARSL
jgi:hypothetical protein